MSEFGFPWTTKPEQRWKLRIRTTSSRCLGKYFTVTCSPKNESGEDSKPEGHWRNKVTWLPVRWTATSESPASRWLRDSNEFALLSRKYINISQQTEPSQELGEVKGSKFSIFPSWEAFKTPMGMSGSHLHLGSVSDIFPQRYFTNQFSYH